MNDSEFRLAQPLRFDPMMPFRRVVPFAVLLSLVACDVTPKEDSAASENKPAESEAEKEKPKATAAAIPEADYPKAIVGKWKKTSSMLHVPGTDPFDALPPGMEMHIEFTADGQFINSGIVGGETHQTKSPYTLTGSSFRVGSNEGSIQIVELTKDKMVQEIKVETGKTVDTYERVAATP